MFTDTVGHTALGQRDESLSIAVMNEQRRLLPPILRRYNEREAKNIGDGFFIEFRSVLEAARCAYEIQRTIRKLNLSREDKKFSLRVGVHVGDVIEAKNGDIFGDAVNVASRIQSLAEPGGICLTRQVYDQIQNKFELPLQSLGAKLLKNVTNRLEIYKMVMPWEERRAMQLENELDTSEKDGLDLDPLHR